MAAMIKAPDMTMYAGRIAVSHAATGGPYWLRMSQRVSDPSRFRDVSGSGFSRPPTAGNREYTLNMSNKGEAPKTSRQEAKTPQLTRVPEYNARQSFLQGIRKISEIVSGLIHKPTANVAPPRECLLFLNA